MSETDASETGRPCRLAVIVRRAGRVLLARAPGAEAWSLPSGRPRPDESIQTAAARLVREATGLIVQVGAVVDAVSPPGAGHVDLVFEAEEIDGSLQPGPGLAELSFWPLSGLPSAWDAPGHRAVLARVRLAE